MNQIINNWYIIFAFGCMTAFVVVQIVLFSREPRKKQIDNLKEFLKWAVIIAEKDLGSGTGQLKLRQVYSMAIDKFSWVAQIITFEQFSIWVDEALDWAKKQLEQNKAIEGFVK